MDLLLTVGAVIALVTGLSMPTYILVKYVNSRKLSEQISIAKVIISLAIWVFLSACMLAVLILCAMAAKQSSQGKASPWAVSAVFLGLLLCYLFAGYVISSWVKRREGIQTLSGRL
jgi:uncharacterized BrkB/YihY/UPF0761 family membrane protein